MNDLEQVNTVMEIMDSECEFFSQEKGEKSSFHQVSKEIYLSLKIAFSKFSVGKIVFFWKWFF